MCQKEFAKDHVLLEPARSDIPCHLHLVTVILHANAKAIQPVNKQGVEQFVVEHAPVAAPGRLLHQLRNWVLIEMMVVIRQ